MRIEKNIGALDIAVTVSLRVHVTQGLEKLPEDTLCLDFSKLIGHIHEAREIVRDILQDKKQVSLVLFPRERRLVFLVLIFPALVFALFWISGCDWIVWVQMLDAFAGDNFDHLQQIRVMQLL